MKETTVQKHILQAIGCLPFLRIWRNNTGQAWTGNGARQFHKRETVTVQPGDVLIRDAHPINFGLKGSADILGIMQGGRFFACEVKQSHGKQSDQQRNFEAMINDMGGVYIVARSPEEALAKINEVLEEG